MQMKALKSFFGNEGKIRRGRAFEVESQARADDLERRGLAIKAGATMATVSAKPQANKAAEAGPLPWPGGETGGVTMPSSAHRVQAPRKPGSKG